MKDYSKSVLIPTKGVFGYYLRSDKMARNVRNKLGEISFQFSEEMEWGERKVFFKLKNKDKITSDFNYIRFYAKDQALAIYFDKNKYANINFSTGEISDEFYTALYPFYYDKDKKLFTMDKDGNFVYNGYEYAGSKIPGDMYHAYFAVVDENGKVGIMDKKGKLYYDCKFNNVKDLNMVNFSVEGEFVERIYDAGSKKTILKYENQEFEFNAVNPELFKLKKGYFSIYDQENNKSFLFRMDKDKKAIEEHGQCDGKISKMIINKENKQEMIYFLSDDAKNLYAPNGVTILKDCTNIEQKSLGLETIFTYKQKVGKSDYAGVYSTWDNKIVLDPNQKCNEVDLNSAAKAPDNTFRFLAEKSVVENGNKKKCWGVIDSNGKTLVDFEFTKGDKKTFCSYRKSSELGYEVEDFKLIDKNNKPRYFNLKESVIETTGKARYDYPKSSNFVFDNPNCHLKSSDAYKQSERIASGFSTFYSFSLMGKTMLGL